MSSSETITIIFLPKDWTSAVTILISSIATTSVVIYGIYEKIHKQVLGKMVLIVNAADLVFCLIMLSNRVFSLEDDLQCKIVQALAHSALIYSLLLGIFFGHALYTMAKYQTLLALDNLFSDYVKISIGLSLSLGIATIFTNYTQYSADQGNCVHLALANKPDVTLIIFSQIPITIACVLSIIWYVWAGCLLKRGSRIIKIKNILALLIYPGIVIFCWLPVNIVTTSETFGHSVDPVVDRVTKNIYQLQGLLDALVYGIAPVMKKICASKNQVEDNDATEEDQSDGRDESKIWSSLAAENEYNEQNLKISLN